MHLFSPEIFSFIVQHENDDIQELLLKFKEIHGIPAASVADQIQSRKKARQKLPSFYRTEGIIFPKPLNLEQSSSEKTAQLKADFVSGVTIAGKSGADLTGGTGVDSLYLSRNFQKFHFVEPDQSLCRLAEHNLGLLGAQNITVSNTSAEDFVELSRETFDLIYLDPSRRENDRKVVSFASCSPDVVRLQSSIFQRTTRLLVKASPLMDLQQGARELQYVKKIMVLSVDNECKEVLFYSEKDYHGEPSIDAVNITGSQKQIFSFAFSQERVAKVSHGPCQEFLFEPNASILKSGSFRLVAERFNLTKLHQNTHLYTSDMIPDSFPGRVFRRVSGLKPDKKEAFRIFPDGKANVITRNYPLHADALKKKTGLHDGGDRYVLAFTDVEGKKVIVADRLA